MGTVLISLFDFQLIIPIVGYTVLALNQTVQSKVDSRTHIDWPQDLVPRLRKRQGVAILTRLTVILDEEGEKGNGIVRGQLCLDAINAPSFPCRTHKTRLYSQTMISFHYSQQHRPHSRKLVSHIAHPPPKPHISSRSL